MSQIIKISNTSFLFEDLKPAVDSLRHGGIIAYPTETIYGLGANIYLENAVHKLYGIKGRESGKPISALIASLEDLNKLCRDIKQYASAVIEKFWPGPLTLVFKAGSECPEFLSSEENKIGIRYPDHKISRALVKALGAPITSTSANLSGCEPAIRITDFSPMLNEQLDVIIDAGESPIQTPSTVVDVSGDSPVLLRAGAIAFEDISSSLMKRIK